MFMNLYQHANNQTFLLFITEIPVDLKILQSDWLTAFWHISQEPDFSWKCDLYMNIVNNINFHYRLNAQKIND